MSEATRLGLVHVEVTETVEDQADGDKTYNIAGVKDTKSGKIVDPVEVRTFCLLSN